MKKAIALILLLVIVLGLCACGGPGDATVSTGSEPETQPYAGPTPEERDMMNEYYEILCALNRSKYVDISSVSAYDRETDITYTGSQAMEYYYQRLSGMEAIDKWTDTGYTAYWSEEINWDRKAVLAEDFAIVKDVKLSETKTIQKGHLITDTHSPWVYDENGRLIRVESEYYVDRVSFMDSFLPDSDLKEFAAYRPEYDENGRILKKLHGPNYRVDAVETYTYDEAGCLTNIHVKISDWETDCVCTCDDAGRLIRIAWENQLGVPFTITYSYDAGGRMVKEEKTQFSYYFSGDLYIFLTQAMEYTYDDSSCLTSGTYTEQFWDYHVEWIDGLAYISDNFPLTERQNQYAYTCDDSGRVVSVTVTPGNGVYIHSVDGHEAGEIIDEPNYLNATIETVYGDYYIYSPKN
ncbi:MAG: hypothetical protein ACI4PO_07945 [Faecousia sp.]